MFYDKGSYSDGWRYLEAWTADESSIYLWKTSSASTPGTSTAIGAGYANTYTYMTGTIHSAAEVVRNATHGGCSDWFLPSKDELNKMYINLQSGMDENGVSYTPVGGFANGTYWSSSEASGINAWCQDFLFSTQASMHKFESLYVRAVRAF